MTFTIEAVYENGVLKPEKPLPFKEHEKVTLTIESAGPSLAERIAAAPPRCRRKCWIDSPKDGAAQHDHYIYGTPKRPE